MPFSTLSSTGASTQARGARPNRAAMPVPETLASGAGISHQRPVGRSGSGFAYQTSASHGAGKEGCLEPGADVAEQKRDDLTEEFASDLPGAGRQLIELFQRVKVMDQEAEQYQRCRPELRGQAFVCSRIGSPRALTLTKLLGLSGQVVWPPPAPPLALQMTMPVIPHPGRHWFEAIEQRDQERHAEAQRVAAYYQKTGEREQRDAAKPKPAAVMGHRHDQPDSSHSQRIARLQSIDRGADLASAVQEMVSHRSPVTFVEYPVCR